MWWSSNLIMPYIKTNVVMFVLSFGGFVRKNDSCIIINSLVTSFVSESRVSGVYGLSCVVHPYCS